MTRSLLHKLILAAAFIITTAVYWPGLSGSFLFDDYPNIVDNHDVQPREVSFPALVRVALSSPASEFKRPLASLSFGVNYLATGLNPYWMKLTNLLFHLLNGLLVFLLARSLLQCAADGLPMSTETSSTSMKDDNVAAQADSNDIIAAFIAAGWMLLPINITAVLYIVQRMESMANIFVLLGLLGYIAGRRRMLASPHNAREHSVISGSTHLSCSSHGFIICVISITIPAAIGMLAKETAVMLPLYALLIEWTLFRFSSRASCELVDGQMTSRPSAVLPESLKETEKKDRRITSLFLLVLVVPMLVGLAWLLPGLLKSESWANRDFTLGTRLLSEARIVVDYITWTLLPTPDALSFYHDNFRISTGLLTPWSTIASIIFLMILVGVALRLRSSRPLIALGITLFLGCHLLTATILPLELVYEHRNYFASFGLMLAILPLLAAPTPRSASVSSTFILPRRVLLAGLLLLWAGQTAMTALAWGNPLHLAEDLAARAPDSPRAQYELGRTYIIYSHYDPASPFTRLAYAPLERSAALPDSSILAEQALIFMNARMHLPLKDAWWDSMIAKLKEHKPGVQDESALGSLTQCARDHECDLPANRMMAAYIAALSHPGPSARLLATYGDYAWNVLDDHALGLRMTEDAVKSAPREPAYRITLVRMLVAQGRKDDARAALHGLQALDFGGSLDSKLRELRGLPGMQ